MKIEIFGDKTQVSSVVAERSQRWKDIQLEVLINTTDRWIPFHRSGSSVLLDGALSELDSTKYQCFDIGQNEEGLPLACVTVIAENDFEATLINGVYYEHQNKDQIMFLCLPMGAFVNNDLKTLSSYPN